MWRLYINYRETALGNRPFTSGVRGYVVRLLEFTKGNVSKAAELAGKYRADFYNLVKKYNLKPEDSKNIDKK